MIDASFISLYPAAVKRIPNVASIQLILGEWREGKENYEQAMFRMKYNYNIFSAIVFCCCYRVNNYYICSIVVVVTE